MKVHLINELHNILIDRHKALGKDLRLQNNRFHAVPVPSEGCYGLNAFSEEQRVRKMLFVCLELRWEAWDFS